MNVFNEFRELIAKELDRLAAEGVITADLDAARFSVEPPRDAAHGDVSTNAAMVLAKAAGMKPRDLAEKLADGLGKTAHVAAAEVAGPGFVNLRLDDGFWRAQLGQVLRDGLAYGDSTIGGRRKVNAEYVSANPTGPMHVGHGRGAVVGDALANLLAKAGFDVTREYYINDAGVQVDTLARSLHLRYREALGEDIGEIPAGLYPGDYLVETAAALVARDGDKWRDAAEDDWLPVLRDFAVAAMMDLIRDDLGGLGITHDVVRSEREIAASGAVDEAIEDLEARGLIYIGTLEPPKGKTPDDWEPRPQTLFRSTQFGDDVDRPIRKSDGSWTYFAADIAYHRDKFRRGFETLIDVWGADHKGYIKRMQAAVEAVTEGGATLDVRVCNLVHLFEGGEPVRMSKRSGAFVTLREVVDRVGPGAVRFMMLTRGADAALDFDLEKVLEQSRDNPVFYVQYAHARACSVMRHAAEAFAGAALDDAALAEIDTSALDDEAELALIRLIAGWPRLVEAAADSHEPHRVAYYMADVAAAFHGLWTKGNVEERLRFIVPGDEKTTLARLALVRAMALVVASGLGVMGVEPVEEMR